MRQCKDCNSYRPVSSEEGYCIRPEHWDLKVEELDESWIVKGDDPECASGGFEERKGIMRTAQYYRFLALERKDVMIGRMVRKQIAEEKRREKEKYLKVYPDESFNWMVLAFDPQCLWDGIISEMEEGDKMVVEVVEMTREEREILPEFEGW